MAEGAHSFYEFFAGGGMARLGLGTRGRCAFANDFDPDKAEAYARNFGADHLRREDVWTLNASDLPGRAELAWASSPCQDLSLAGGRAGLEGGRSSAFWGFWRLVKALQAEGRAPHTVVVENVVGLLTSRGGEDFRTLCATLAEAGYAFGALEVDAALWTPQSRPRLFVIATRRDPSGVSASAADGRFHTPAIRRAHASLPADLASRWVWWSLKAPPPRNVALADVLEPDAATAWDAPERTARLLALLGEPSRARLQAAAACGRRIAGSGFRRMRTEAGRKVQRVEVRFDGLAGCLRTPAGGSSRQILFSIDPERGVRTRLLTPREAARLMGLPDDYVLPKSRSAALKLCGDGVAVPVVSALAEQILTPLARTSADAAAA
jgi:DNA (cytosine-5)-methyltransferase 1